MRQINLIVIHCSATPNGDSLFRGSFGTPGFLTPAQVVDGWHAKRGFKRNAASIRRFSQTLPHIGYHYLVYTNGAVTCGRGIDEIGAHAQGFNQKSIGVCLIGTDRFTRAQWTALAGLVAGMLKHYPGARVVGHRDLSPDQDKNGIVEPFEWLKTCPGFDVARWVEGGMQALSDHLLLG